MASVAIPGRRTRGALTVQTIQDRTVLREFLERDRLLAAYALCDLEDREFNRTRCGAAFDGDRLIALVLEYSGMTPQPMFVMGRDDGIEAILRDVVRPRAAYVAALTESLPAVQGQYRVDPGPPMVRMWVDKARFRPYPADVRRLLPVEIGELNRLYQLVSPRGFPHRRSRRGSTTASASPADSWPRPAPTSSAHKHGLPWSATS